MITVNTCTLEDIRKYSSIYDRYLRLSITKPSDDIRPFTDLLLYLTQLKKLTDVYTEFTPNYLYNDSNTYINLCFKFTPDKSEYTQEQVSIIMDYITDIVSNLPEDCYKLETWMRLSGFTVNSSEGDLK